MSQQELVLQQPAHLARQESALSPADLMAGIHRLASDPGMDVAKMEALIRLLTEQQDRNARAEFNSAMVSCQAEMPRVKKDDHVVMNFKGGGSSSTRYAKLERIDALVRPIYEKYGFSVSYGTAPSENNKYIITAKVRHSGGHSEEYRMPLALDQSGQKNDTQGMGSTMTYGKRYLLCSIFNIITEGEDNDGQKQEAVISQDQADTLRTLLTDKRKDRAKFLASVSKQAGCEVAKIEEIPTRLFSGIMQWLNGENA